MLAQNIEVVQPEDWARPGQPTFNTPIFLIHDGGGTTFAYHCLEPLGRYVYGIQNPYFCTGQVFEGGLPEMGRLYAAWIRDTVVRDDFPARRKNVDSSVNIMLGGWSLGGLLSLEVARRLAEDPLVRVVGILMVDSVCLGRSRGPVPTSALEMPGVKAADTPSDRSTTGLTKNKLLSQRCMAEAMRMVRTWHIPEWNGKLSGRQPRSILLRAKEYIPVSGRGIAGLDLSREDRLLGWGDYDDDMFDDVIDVDGHHFNMFAMDKIDGISKAIKRSFDRLDQYSHVMAFPDCG